MFLSIVVILIFSKLSLEIVLDLLNRNYTKLHAGSLPAALRGVINKDVYFKTIPYTLTKNSFSMYNSVFSTLVLIAIIVSGILPFSFHKVMDTAFFKDHYIWGQSFYLFGITIVLSIASIPYDLYSHFILEEKFGFNKMTAKLWIMDHVKGLMLGLIIGVPVISVLLKIVYSFPGSWWIAGFVFVTLFQMVLMVIYPKVIMPLFNKFTPLEDGSLKKRLFALAKKADFPVQNIFVMDGSKRSGHSNAFFTGFGKFRRIVIFDTLIDQLTEEELEGVLAHEIGHFKLGHIPKRLITGILFLLLTFYVIYLLSNAAWFVDAFGFNRMNLGAIKMIAPVFLIFSMFGGLFTFWTSPISNIFSRKHEYQADAFAKKLLGSADPLVSALRKLNQKNLSNMLPHPVYSFCYYSHPVFIEREKKLQ